MSSTIGTRKVNKKSRSTGRLKSHTRLQARCWNHQLGEC
jgi:hypothetical protein